MVFPFSSVAEQQREQGSSDGKGSRVAVAVTAEQLAGWAVKEARQLLDS